MLIHCFRFDLSCQSWTLSLIGFPNVKSYLTLKKNFRLEEQQQKHSRIGRGRVRKTKMSVIMCGIDNYAQMIRRLA